MHQESRAEARKRNQIKPPAAKVALEKVDIGQYVVLPGIGLAVTSGLRKMFYANQPVEMVQFSPLEQKLARSFALPKARLTEGGIRIPAQRDEVEQALNILFGKSKAKNVPGAHHVVANNYKRTLVSNDVSGIANAIKMAMNNESYNGLSFTKTAFADKGILFLAHEIAFNTGMSIGEAQACILGQLRNKNADMPAFNLGNRLPEHMPTAQFRKVFGISIQEAAQGQTITKCEYKHLSIAQKLSFDERYKLEQHVLGEEPKSKPREIKVYKSAGSIGRARNGGMPQTRSFLTEDMSYSGGAGDGFSSFDDAILSEQLLIREGMPTRVFDTISEMLRKDRINLSVFQVYVRSELRKAAHQEPLRAADILLRDQAVEILRQEFLGQGMSREECNKHSFLKVMQPDQLKKAKMKQNLGFDL